MLIQCPISPLWAIFICFCYMHIRIASYKSDVYVFITLAGNIHVGESGLQWGKVEHLL